MTGANQMKKGLPLSPGLGHPFGQAEVLDPNVDIESVIDALQDRGLIVEGEYGIEVSGDGNKLRALVKFRPREGFVSKLMNRMNLDINLSTKEWFGITKK